ncbi:ORF82 [Ranid herpesvirus 2]|uniref:ORF82 n=1 Tax=Ranid herpesvirus 2 TaxID=389214 RepID=Q14W24_9VIRU|nr:ORF82 [Ranid herpesvirus 2]ABG25595.1 ORF82 [Ranid herpesvirus 2]
MDVQKLRSLAVRIYKIIHNLQLSPCPKVESLAFLEPFSRAVPVLVLPSRRYYYSPLACGPLPGDLAESAFDHMIIASDWFRIQPMTDKEIKKQAHDEFYDTVMDFEDRQVMVYAPGSWTRFSAGSFVMAGTRAIDPTATVRYDGMAGRTYEKNDFIMFAEGTLAHASQYSLLPETTQTFKLPDGLILHAGAIKSRWSRLCFTPNERLVNCEIMCVDGITWLHAVRKVRKAHAFYISLNSRYRSKPPQCVNAYGPFEGARVVQKHRAGAVVYQYGPTGVEGFSLLMNAVGEDGDVCNNLTYMKPKATCLMHEFLKELCPAGCVQMAESAEEAVSSMGHGLVIVNPSKNVEEEIYDAETTLAPPLRFTHPWLPAVPQHTLPQQTKTQLLAENTFEGVMRLLVQAGTELYDATMEIMLEGVRRVHQPGRISAGQHLRYYVRHNPHQEWGFDKTLKVVSAALMESLCSNDDHMAYAISCCFALDGIHRLSRVRERLLTLFSCVVTEQALRCCTCFSDAYMCASLFFQNLHSLQLKRIALNVATILTPNIHVHMTPTKYPVLNMSELNDYVGADHAVWDAVNALSTEPNIVKHIKGVLGV